MRMRMEIRSDGENRESKNVSHISQCPQSLRTADVVAQYDGARYHEYDGV
jgi:hypothetical protein